MCSVIGVSQAHSEDVQLKRHVAAQAWAQCLKVNKSLVHVDISHN